MSFFFISKSVHCFYLAFCWASIRQDEPTRCALLWEPSRTVRWMWCPRDILQSGLCRYNRRSPAFNIHNSHYSTLLPKAWLARNMCNALLHWTDSAINWHTVSRLFIAFMPSLPLLSFWTEAMWFINSCDDKRSVGSSPLSLHSATIDCSTEAINSTSNIGLSLSRTSGSHRSIDSTTHLASSWCSFAKALIFFWIENVPQVWIKMVLYLKNNF